jgi:phosphohistidine swiveling domain-containing protein
MGKSLLLLHLHQRETTNSAVVGPKAARLATLLQKGFTVPPACVLTVNAYQQGLTEAVQKAIATAFDTLQTQGHTIFAVRSSAIAEDTESASYAGMQDTVLGVKDLEGMVEAVKSVWQSYSAAHVETYRQQMQGGDGGIAVIIQHQIAANVAGVAFAHDPVTGEEAIVIEAIAGLGEALVSGRAEPQRWRGERREEKGGTAGRGTQDAGTTTSPPDPSQEGEDSQVHVASPVPLGRENGEIENEKREKGTHPLTPSQEGEPIPKAQVSSNVPLGWGNHDESLLNEQQIKEIHQMVKSVGEVFGSPQDVEWAYGEGQLWILQSRPITTLREDWFTTRIENDGYVWGAGFLNERFTLPVSPLGWTMVADPLEQLAFRAPLELLGAGNMHPPLLKLWQGHPYSRVEAWQRIYKLFPDWLLPEDAVRFFPNGDTSLRHAPRHPTYGIHLIGNALKVLRRNWSATAPWENPKGWAQYERKQTAVLIRLEFETRQLEDVAHPIAKARWILQQSATLTDELLEYHRWSLLYTDVFYSLLKRWMIARFGGEEGTRRTVELTTHVESPTTRLNRALNQLVIQTTKVRDEVLAVAEGAPLPETGEFWEKVRHFLRDYGHRFMSLDIYDAPWEADPQGFARFLLTLTPTADHPVSTQSYNGLIRLTRAYMHLREAQRFYWQKVMALQRRIIVWMGQWWAEQGELASPDEVFGLTWAELLNDTPNPTTAAERMTRLAQLRQEAELHPAWHYPDFLRGNRPLLLTTNERTLHGRPVSPGMARGRARVITSPQDFGRVMAGDILVTFAPDPGWTPLFGTVAGMVTERGGQLSHGAVVAREYQLPAVSGIAGLLATIQEGELLLVDGTKGIVVREE